MQLECNLLFGKFIFNVKRLALFIDNFDRLFFKMFHRLFQVQSSCVFQFYRNVFILSLFTYLVSEYNTKLVDWQVKCKRIIKTAKIVCIYIRVKAFQSTGDGKLIL